MITNTLAIVCLVLAGALWAAAGMSFLDWLSKLDARRMWERDVVTRWNAQREAWAHARVSGFAARRANFLPRAGQVWRSSDPRRLSAFRIVHVDPPGIGIPAAARYASIEMITNPGAIGRTARRICLLQFQVLGPKGYTRVA